MLFRTNCGHVTRHRNSRVRREADAACKPLRRGYKVVTAICCKKNFTNTPKKSRFFLFQSPWWLCRTKGVVAGATREQEWDDAGTGIEEWQSCRREDGAGSCGSQAGRRRSRAGRCGSRTGRDHAEAERVDAEAERIDARDDGADAGRRRCGGALRRRGQGGGVSGRKGCFRRKMK